MDELTKDLLNALAIRRSRAGCLLRACRAFGAWARSGANPVNAYRAATRAWSGL